LPKKYKLCNDILILPYNCFQLEIWKRFEKCELYKTVAESFKVKRLALENRIKSNDFRSPNLTLLYGNDSIVQVKNNGIM
jgi:tRNA wybutosine-synthesizing protein 2